MPAERTNNMVRFTGGPHPTDVIVDEEQYPWPLPGIIKTSHPGGFYEKVGEDFQPSKTPGGDSIRIAIYAWREGRMQ